MDTEKTKYYVVQEDIILYSGSYEACEKSEDHFRAAENAYIMVDHECVPIDSDKLEVISHEDFYSVKQDNNASSQS
jgi:hypothetical protein